MKNLALRKTFIIAVAFSGAVLNAAYSIDLLKALFDPQYSGAVREILISAFVLETGWIPLMVWVIFRPLERRHVLLFPIVPILLGNMLHSVNQLNLQSEHPGTIVLNTVFGLLYSGLYVAAFLAGKGENSET